MTVHPRPMLMATLMVLSAALQADAGQSEDYTIRYGEIKPIGNGFYSLQLKEKKVTLEQLLKEMKAPERTTRLDAVRAVELPKDWPKKDRGDLIKALGECLTDQDVAVRYAAGEILGCDVGPDAIIVLPRLLEAVKDEEPFVRRFALRAIAKIGPKAKDAIPVLVKALDDENKFIRRDAAHALTYLGPAAVPALIDSLKDSKGQVRMDILNFIPEMGEDAKPALPALSKLLGDSDSFVAYRVRRAMEDIGNLPEYRRRDY